MVGRLRPGREVAVLDAGESGVRVEGPCRLRPGGTASLNLSLDGQERTIACHVAWCRVSSVAKETGVRYRAGLAFDRPTGLFEPRHADGYGIPDWAAGSGADRGSAYSCSGRRR